MRGALLQYRCGVREEEEEGRERQSFWAKLAMFFFIVSLPIGSPVYLLLILFYQFCLVGRLTVQAKFVTFVSSAFVAVSWIPVVNIIIWAVKLGASTEHVEDLINAFVPLGLFVIFCGWAFWVAVRHFSISDSYEALGERRQLMHLKTVLLNPTNFLEVIPGVSSAFDLYVKLKGPDPPHTRIAIALTFFFTASIVFTSRYLDALQNKRLHNEWSQTIFILATVDFVAIFFVFYSMLAGVLVTFLHELYLLKKLSSCLPDLERWKALRLAAYHQSSLLGSSAPTVGGDAITIGEPPQSSSDFTLTATGQTLVGGSSTEDGSKWVMTTGGKGTRGAALAGGSSKPHSNYSMAGEGSAGSHNTEGGSGSGTMSISFKVDAKTGKEEILLSPVNTSHLRAWDEVRRVCVQELTSPSSVFQSVFTPTFFINSSGCVLTYAYLVVRMWLLNGSFGGFTSALLVFSLTMLLYMLTTLTIARKARKQFKKHTERICKITFQVSQHRDRKLKETIQQGLDVSRSPMSGARGGTGKTPFRFRDDLMSSLTAMRTYMIANPARLRVFGMELRYLRYAALFIFVFNLGLLFVALMIGLRQGRCQYDFRPEEARSGSTAGSA